MIVENKIVLDVAKKQNPPIVYAVQGDANTRVLKVYLYNNGVEWDTSSVSSISFSYKNQKNGSSGWYDKLPNGENACEVSGNVATVTLVGAVLSSDGDVSCSVIFRDENLNQIGTFEILICVEKNPAAENTIKNNYYKYSTIDQINDALNDLENNCADRITSLNKGEVINIFDSSSRKLLGLNIYGKTTQNGTPTPESPVELENIGGKNYMPKTEYTASGSDKQRYFITTADAFPTLAVGDYTLSFESTTRFFNMTVTFYAASGSIVTSKQFSAEANTKTSVTITLPSEASSMALSSREISGTITNVALNKSGEGGIGVTVAGKNLLPPSSTSNGNFTADGKGGYTSTDASGTIVVGELTLEAGKTYTLSASAANEVVKPCILVRKQDGTTNLKNNYSNPSVPVTYTSPETQSVKVLLQTTSANGRCPSGETFYIQLEIGSTATAYEPYKEIQTLTVSTPNGLPGIPVSSGGNYTDENGQQWVCDEIDFARGVYVQRIVRCSSWAKGNSLTNTIPYTSATYADCISGTKGVAICNITNKYSYSQSDSVHMYVSDSTTNALATIYVPVGYDMAANPVEMLVARTTPVETALSAEELEAYVALHSNKPNTTVLNDGGAGMAIEYVADTKTYIDNKFAELQYAILAAGANV